MYKVGPLPCNSGVVGISGGPNTPKPKIINRHCLLPKSAQPRRRLADVMAQLETVTNIMQSVANKAGSSGFLGLPFVLGSVAYSGDVEMYRGISFGM